MRFVAVEEESRIWNQICIWHQLTCFALCTTFAVCATVFTGNFNRSCSCMVVQWLAQSSVCGVCTFSQCLRGFSSACPVPSHRSESCTLGWSEAVIVPVGVSECCVSCGGLVTCPEWIPASCQVTAWRHSSTSHDLDQEYRSLPDLLRAEATLGALDI